MLNKIIKYWLPVFLWMAFIFYLSHQPGLKSDFPFYWDFVLRKIAHITEYFILTFLLIRALNQCQFSKRKVLVLSFAFALAYAVSDEYHQTFILARSGAFLDVLIDSFGIVLSTWLCNKRMIK